MQERIIGAIVLVVFVVLVVPVFLDGPPDDNEIVSARVLLPGQEDQDVKTVVLDRERTAPIPLAENEDSTRNVPGPATQPADRQPQPVVEQPDPKPVANDDRAQAASEPEPKANASAPLQTASLTGMWAVQLGSFSNEDNAEKLAADLRKQGYAAFVSQHRTGSDQYYRVRIGPQKDRESADAMAARLLKVGHEGQVLPHP